MNEYFMSDEMPARSCVWSEVQMTCIWSSWCHCHDIISCFIKFHVSDIAILQHNRLRWYGHVLRKDKTTLIGWRNVWITRWRAPDQEVDKRGHGEVVQKDCQARNLNRQDAMDHGRWKKLIKIGWSGWWVGECFFWYRLTRVVPDKGP